MKKLNRNAFNEKLIHRYYFETLYLDKKERINLVPPSLKKRMKDLNLIVPEDVKSFKNYRADFSLYFKNDPKFYPVEVKWKTSDLKKNNQIDALRKNRGFLVAFDQPQENDIIDCATINKDHFQDWLIKRAELLVEESISDKVETKYGSGKWIVVCRGAAFDNFDKMEQLVKRKFGNKTPKRFWAHKNSRFVMKNMLNLRIGDELLFMFVKDKGGNQAMSALSNNNLQIFRAVLCKVTEPYYMQLDGEKSTFFEGKSIANVGERKWPHFYDFSVNKNEDYRFNKKEKLINRKLIDNNLKRVIAESANQGGVLQSLNELQMEDLKAMIRTNIFDKG